MNCPALIISSFVMRLAESSLEVKGEKTSKDIMILSGLRACLYGSRAGPLSETVR